MSMKKMIQLEKRTTQKQEKEVNKMKKASLSYKAGWRAISAIKRIPNSKKKQFNDTVKMCAKTMHDLHRSENKAIERVQKHLKRVHK